MKKGGIVLHPLLLVRLVHMMRHRHVHEAVALAGNEIQIALEDDAGGGGDEDEDGGIVIVPSPRRLRELHLESESDEPSLPKGPSR
jgi:hypothetical protein